MMNKLILSFLVTLFTVNALAQSGTKVKWEYSTKKIADKKYEVRMVATIRAGIFTVKIRVKMPLRYPPQ